VECPISSSFASAATRRILIVRPHAAFICESRFIMKYTSGSTRGSAITIAAIDMSTSSSRR
jgi:hypothetical protein